MINITEPNRVAVVTGAGGTLCSEMARALAKQGIKVALLGRSLEKLIPVEADIKALGGIALSVPVDVTCQQQVEEAHARILQELGLCSILINGAGGNQMAAVTTINEFHEQELENENPEFRGFFNLKMDAFLSVLQTNTMGTVIPSHIFARDMVKNGGGSIINLASMNSYRPLTRVPAYGMAKAGIANFTQWLSAYLAPAHIRVNAIAPGFFLNETSKKRLLKPDGELSDRGKDVIAHTPMRSFGEAKQLVGCMNWLIDDEASGFVTGTVIPVDGGFMATSGV